MSLSTNNETKRTNGFGIYGSDIALQPNKDCSHRADPSEGRSPDVEMMINVDKTYGDDSLINLDYEASPDKENVNKTTTLSEQNIPNQKVLYFLVALLIIVSIVSIILGNKVYALNNQNSSLENQISSLEDEITALNKDINLLRILEENYCVGPDGEIINKHLAKVVDNYAWHTKFLSTKDSEGILARKDIVATYINNLNMDYEEKIILFKSQYPSDDTYNEEIIEYLNNRSDISYDEMVSILKELGFTIEPDGSILW